MDKEIKKPKNYYLLGLLVSVLINPILGLISIYYSSRIAPNYDSGDYKHALNASRNAKFFSMYVVIIVLIFNIVSSLVSGEAIEAINNGYFAAKNF